MPGVVTIKNPENYF